MGNFVTIFGNQVHFNKRMMTCLLGSISATTCFHNGETAHASKSFANQPFHKVVGL